MVPATGLLNVIVAVALLHTVWLSGVATTAGTGYTSMAVLTGVPEQPCATGVTVTVSNMVVVPLLSAMNEGKLPLPLAARPIEVLLLVQLKLVLLAVPPNITG